MILRIKSVRYLKEYKLKVLFSNGKIKIVDFENWINEGGTYFFPLRDLEYFKNVQMDEFNYSICWPNGADFSPDVLYEFGKEIEQARKIPSTRRRRAKTSSL